MEDKNKPTAISPSASSGLTRKQTVSLPGLHARLRSPAAKANDALTRTNRLALMLDVSGSMHGDKIQSLRDAVTGFINACDFSNTAVALEPFGEGNPPPNRMDLNVFGPLLLSTVQMLNANGSTPMANAMDYVLNSYSITRGVIVSDGQPDSEAAVYESVEHYRGAEIPVDCVHIGHDTHGEACLRRVAETTGGQFIKFTDIASFSKSFKYLTPRYYAMLTGGHVTAAELGAKELK